MNAKVARLVAGLASLRDVNARDDLAVVQPRRATDPTGVYRESDE